MRDLNRSGTKRIAAGIMGFLMLVIVLFSAFYILAEADHDCCGDDCPICIGIRQCEQTLRQMGGRAAARPAVLPAVLSVLFTAVLFAAEISRNTPVSRKVRLND